jgi:molecular chaperone GrpE
MIPHEPSTTRSVLRDALAEAAASYASAEAAASDAARAASASGDRSAAGADDDATHEATGRPAPVTARRAPAAARRAPATGPALAGEPEADLQALADELRAATAERDQYLDHLQRLKAEFENYRKRVQRDNEALVLRAGESVLESLLPVLDNMARALESAQRHEEGQLIQGVELVSAQLRAVLAGHGLDEVPAAPGLPFDPHVHEAVAAQSSTEYCEGLISAVLEPGYLLHGRLLRPARVIVAS